MGFPLPSSLLQSSGPSPLPEQDYLIGFRGLVVIESFLWCFLSTFVPAAVANSKNTEGPLYQIILRKSLSVLFWNDALIYSFFVFLSARTICLPFLKDSNRVVCSSSIFRRGIRLWVPTFVAFGLSALLFSHVGLSTTYVADFASGTENTSITVPRQIPTFLNYFNSLFEIFWINKNYAIQAANTAFPNGCLWVVSLLFQQSYTVYMTMVTIPFTRRSWRVKAFFTFIITAWWVQSWAWYSVTAMLLADAVMNMNFREKSARGIRFTRRFTFPLWALYGTLMFAGLLLQYLFIAWRPQYRNAELKGHTGLYNAGSLNDGDDPNEPQARDDNFLLILGFFLLLETYEWMQKLFMNPFFVFLGRRSFSYFLTQSIIIFTAGIKLFSHLRFTQTMSLEVSTFICLIACLPLTALSAEIFHRLVDVPTQKLGRVAYEFATK